MPDRPKSIQPPESARETVWRQTFLAQFDDPDDRAVLQRFGDLLFTLACAGGYLGSRDRRLLTSQLLGASEDLDELAAFCQEVAEEPLHSELDREDLETCRLADEVAGRLGDLAAETRDRLREIGGEPEPANQRPLNEEIREAEALSRRLAEHHPDPQTRRIYRRLVERAAATAKGGAP